MKAAFLVQSGNSQIAFEIRETVTPQIKDNEILVRVETFGHNYRKTQSSYRCC